MNNIEVTLDFPATVVNINPKRGNSGINPSSLITSKQTGKRKPKARGAGSKFRRFRSETGANETPFANTDFENEAMKLNATNERIKRSYRIFLKEADGKAAGTIEQIMKAIERYEIFSARPDFGTFDQRRAVRFKQHLANEVLAMATILTVTTSLKRFFGWLSHQPGHKSRISRNDIEYLNLADCDVRAAKAPSERAVPSLEQVCRAFEAMPVRTPIELRDRAVMAILALTGIPSGTCLLHRAIVFARRRNI